VAKDARRAAQLILPIGSPNLSQFFNRLHACFAMASAPLRVKTGKSQIEENDSASPARGDDVYR
jgi:hypothetical protein